MKRLILSASFLLLCVLASAQHVQVKKTPFIAKSGTIFNVNTSVALNTKTGQTLIVWERVNGDSHTILGRLMDAQGKPVGAEFVLVPYTKASHPSVAYNSTKNEFLLAYDDNPNFALVVTSIYIQRLTQAGKLNGSLLRVTADSLSSTLVNYLPKVVFNPKTNSYVLLWIREIRNATQEGPNNGLVAVPITAGAALGGSIVVVRPTIIDSGRVLEPILLDATFHPTTGKLILGYVQHISGTGLTQVNYSLGNVNANLAGISNGNFTKINANPVNVSGFVWGLKFAFQSTGVGFVVFVDNGNTKRRTIDATGKLTGSSVAAFHSPKANTKLFYPTVVLTNGAAGVRGLLLAVQDPLSTSGLATVWVQAVDGNGLPLGAALKVDTTSATETAFGSQLVALPQAVTSTSYHFADFYALTQFTSPGQTYQASGINLLAITLTFP